MKFKNLYLVTAIAMLGSLATPASAVAPYTNTNAGFSVSVDTTSSWAAENSNGLDRMKFTLDRATPTTFSFVISATDTNGPVNLSNYDCFFQTGASTFATTSNGLTLTKTASSAQSITCAVATTANFSINTTEFKISPSGNLNGTGVTGRIGLSFASQATPSCMANGSPATLSQYGLTRTTLTTGESYQIAFGGQAVSSPCRVTVNGPYWVRTSMNGTVVTVSGTVSTSEILFSGNTITYAGLLTGLGSQGYSAQVVAGDIWKREIFTTPSAPNQNDTPVATMTLVLGVTGISASPTVTAAPSVYVGPEILAVDTFRPIVAGGKLTFTGKNLSAVTSATIGAKAASLSFDAATGLTIGTPVGLAPGKYDLVMQSSYGVLTHINAVTVKAPTPTTNIGFRSDDKHLSEQQVLDLVAFNKTLNPDYEKVRCIVNSSDAKTAQRIADLVCAHVARGEARNVEVIKEIRNTYPGEGFWVRVYAAG